jgi:hypothetical protein
MCDGNDLLALMALKTRRLWNMFTIGMSPRPPKQNPSWVDKASTPRKSLPPRYTNQQQRRLLGWGRQSQ